MVFSILIKVFYFILVSSLGVHLYTSRSSAKDFFTLVDGKAVMIDSFSDLRSAFIDNAELTFIQATEA